MIEYDPKAAQTALLALSDLLRAVLDNFRNDQDVVLANEWALAQRYLALEKLRYGERLRIESALTPAALECLVPSLTLQPLVENAIHHAIAPRSRGGTVRILADRTADRLRLIVEDNGPGAKRDELRHASGIGLATVRRRLALRHKDLGFDVQTAPGAGFRVAIDVPAINSSP